MNSRGKYFVPTAVEYSCPNGMPVPNPSNYYQIGEGTFYSGVFPPRDQLGAYSACKSYDGSHLVRTNSKEEFMRYRVIRGMYTVHFKNSGFGLSLIHI